MNNPTQITLSNSLVNNQSAPSTSDELVQLPEQVLAAKNIQFSKGSITLDVLIDKHWQTLRLGITHAPQNTDKIASANIQLSADGKQLNITPNNTNITLSNASQLQRFLNYVSTGSEIQSKPLPVNVQLSPSPQLMIPSLNASIAINKETAQLLNTEQPLQVLINTTNKGAQINVINRFADTVHTQTLSQHKISQLLTNLLPSAQLQATPKLAIISHPQHSGSFTTPITNKQLSELPSKPVAVNITNQADKLLIKTNLPKMQVALNNSFSKPFTDLVLSQQQNAARPPADKTSPQLSAQSPIKSWLQSSFSDLKTRINDAVKYFENKPFASKTSPLQAQQAKLDVNKTPTQINTLTNLNLSKLNITAEVANHSFTPNSPLAKHFAQLPPLVQITQQLKASVSLWQSANNTAQPQAVSAQPTNVSTQGNASAPLSLKTLHATTSQVNTPNQPSLSHSLFNTAVSQQLQPTEAKILTSLLNLPTESERPNSASNPKTLLSSQITDIASKATQNTPDLTRLVNQAFNRMVSSTNVHPATIQRELLSTLQPLTTPNDTLQSSFTKGLEQLAVTILAAPIISQPSTSLTFNNHTGVDALLNVLLPTFKVGNGADKLLEQLQQTQIQELAPELLQVKNTLSQVQVTTPNQQSDTNPLAQFLFPMKLPPEAGQTEITLGQYKKASVDKTEKNVWFVRLNFDYAQQGQLQIVAELMDKALDCQLLASSQEVSAIAHPHLDSLRAKLAQHGLQVGELNLKRGDASHQAFYQSHAIINIKV